MPLRVTFDDFNFTTLSGNMTYILKLKDVGSADSGQTSTMPIREQGTSLSTQSSSYGSSNLIASEPPSIQNLMLDSVTCNSESHQ